MKKLLLAALLTMSAVVMAQWPNEPATNQAVPQCPGPNDPNMPLGAYRFGILVAELQASAITGWGTDKFTEKLEDLRAITNTRPCSNISTHLDQLIAKSRYTPAQQMQGDIAYLKEHVLGRAISDKCQCKCQKLSQKYIYTIWKNPYGPGPACLTPLEANELKNSGHGVKGPGEPCE